MQVDRKNKINFSDRKWFTAAVLSLSCSSVDDFASPGQARPITVIASLTATALSNDGHHGCDCHCPEPTHHTE